MDKFFVGEKVIISPIIPGLEDIAGNIAIIEEILSGFAYRIKINNKIIKIHQCELKKYTDENSRHKEGK